MTDKLTVGFKRLNENATLPTRAHATDSGFDLYAAKDVIIEPGETTVVPTGIAVKLPPGTEAQVRPRSGVTSRTKLRVQLGTIDNDYRGEIGVIVDNIALPETQQSTLTGEEVIFMEAAAETLDGNYVRTINRPIPQPSYYIREGDRIAQLVVQYLPQVVSEEIVGELDETKRGKSGFGSTGVNE